MSRAMGSLGARRTVTLARVSWTAPAAHRGGVKSRLPRRTGTRGVAITPSRSQHGTAELEHLLHNVKVQGQRALRGSRLASASRRASSSFRLVPSFATESQPVAPPIDLTAVPREQTGEKCVLFAWFRGNQLLPERALC